MIATEHPAGDSTVQGQSHPDGLYLRREGSNQHRLAWGGGVWTELAEECGGGDGLEVWGRGG